MGLKWDDAEEVGIELADAHQGLDPLTVRFTDLHRMVVGLPDFDDDPRQSSESKLEAIQMAWLEEYRERGE
jgi:FeS assembly protein IscX